ncbi:Signal transduction histidine-protein kinase BaeS [Kluyvera intermedia]|nr:Signal transduction histidine-protein kinase BaeS [Kluyvera intermedia]
MPSTETGDSYAIMTVLSSKSSDHLNMTTVTINSPPGPPGPGGGPDRGGMPPHGWRTQFWVIDQNARVLVGPREAVPHDGSRRGIIVNGMEVGAVIGLAG